MSLEVLVPDMKRQLVGYRSQQLTEYEPEIVWIVKIVCEILRCTN